MPLPQKAGFVLLSYVILEILAFLFLRGGLSYHPIAHGLADRHRQILKELWEGERDSYLRPDSDLGWSPRESTTPLNGLYQNNADGIRSNREFSPSLSKNKLRISSYGDSFTYGIEAKLAETWQSHMEKNHPQIEALNFGVSGYGLDQAYLRYLKKASKFASDIVVIGYLSENINRMVNNFQPFYSPDSGMPLSKPRYFIENGKLSLHENPLRSREDYNRLTQDPALVLEPLSRFDYWSKIRPHASTWDFLPSVRVVKSLSFWFHYQIASDALIYPNGKYRESSEAYAITREVFTAFYEAVAKNGSIPLIVIYPTARDIELRKTIGVVTYEPLIQYFHAKGFRFVDLFEGFADTNFPIYAQQHYSARSHGVVARTLWNHLESEGLLHRPSHYVTDTF